MKTVLVPETAPIQAARITARAQGEVRRRAAQVPVDRAAETDLEPAGPVVALEKVGDRVEVIPKSASENSTKGQSRALLEDGRPSRLPGAAKTLDCGKNLCLAESPTPLKQRLQAIARNQRSLRLCCYDPLDDKAFVSWLILFRRALRFFSISTVMGWSSDRS